MFSLDVSVLNNQNPLYPLSKETSHYLNLSFHTESDVNEFLDILAQRGTILEVSLLEV